MIFAIYDLILYQFHLRKYSNESLAKEKARVLTEPLIASIPLGSTIFLHTRKSLLSWIIMYYTDSLWSHVGMKSNNTDIIDATTSGVIEHPLSDYANPDIFFIAFTMIDVPEDIMSNTIQRMKETFLGRPYGWFNVVNIFFHVILAKKSSYRLRFTTEIILLLYFFYIVFPFKIELTLLAGIYLLFTLKNIIVFRKFKVKF